MILPIKGSITNYCDDDKNFCKRCHEFQVSYQAISIMVVLNLYKCSITLLTHTFKHLQTLLIVVELHGVGKEVPLF